MSSQPSSRSIEVEFFRMLNRVVEPLVRAGSVPGCEASMWLRALHRSGDMGFAKQLANEEWPLDHGEVIVILENLPAVREA